MLRVTFFCEIECTPKNLKKGVTQQVQNVPHKIYFDRHLHIFLFFITLHTLHTFLPFLPLETP
jgi:hypothetical protein